MLVGAFDDVGEVEEDEGEVVEGFDLFLDEALVEVVVVEVGVLLLDVLLDVAELVVSASDASVVVTVLPVLVLSDEVEVLD